MYESWCLESAHGKEARTCMRAGVWNQHSGKEARTCMRAGVWNQHMGKRHVHV